MLDTFKEEFLNFSESENPDSKNVEGSFHTFKKVFQRLMVVKESEPMQSTADTSNAMSQYKNAHSVLGTFLNQKVMYKNGSANDLDIVSTGLGNAVSNFQLLMWVMWSKTSSADIKKQLGGEDSKLGEYEFPPYTNPANPLLIQEMISDIEFSDTTTIVDNFFQVINVEPSNTNIEAFASVIKAYVTYSYFVSNLNGVDIDVFINQMFSY